MGDMRYMNWATPGEGVEVDNVAILAGGGRHAIQRLAKEKGALVDVVLGRGGSGRNLFLCLTALEGTGALTVLGFNALTVESMRDWARGFTFPVKIQATPSDVPSDTTHLVLIDDVGSHGPMFECLENLPDLPSLERITFVPTFDARRGLEVPPWVNECTFVKSIRATEETYTWELITTQSFPESTTRTTSRVGVEKTLAA